jgi:hypothetical protein
MQTQDLVILIICAVAIIIVLRQEGNLKFYHAWVIPIDSRLFRNGHAPASSERLPRPIITDLDGDGVNEIIITTREPSLKIYHYDNAAPFIDDWNSAVPEDSLNLVSEVALLSSHRVRAGRYPVALATGYLDPYNPDSSRAQIIVVVTSGWHILCFDHSLKLLWDDVVEADLSGRYLGEVAILIDSHQMRIGDTGTVIVGGRLEAEKDFSKLGLHERDLPTNSNTKDNDEQDEAQHVGAGEPADDHFGGHFSFFAFEGFTGELRWKHEVSDFAEPAPAHESWHDRHHSPSKRAAVHANDAHAGELRWENFRGSVIRSLPHAWASRDDTRFELAHFERRQAGPKPENAQGDYQDILSLDFLNFNDLHGGLRAHAAGEHVRQPNTFVAYLKDGLEVIHLYTGRTLTRVALKKGVAHADINGDGVVEHAEAVGGAQSPYLHEDQLGSKLPPCMALVTADMPAVHQLFNGSVCGERHASLWAPAEAENQRERNLRVALPAFVSVLVDNAPRILSVFFANTGEVTAFEPDGRVYFSTDTSCKWLVPFHEDKAAAAKLAFQNRRRSITGKSPAPETNADRGLKERALLPSVSPITFTESSSSTDLLLIGQGQLQVLTSAGVLRADAPLADVPVALPVVGDMLLLSEPESGVFSNFAC